MQIKNYDHDTRSTFLERGLTTDRQNNTRKSYFRSLNSIIFESESIQTIVDKTEIGLVIILSALTNDRSLFKQAIAELGSSQSQDASLKVLKTAKNLLSDKQRQWIEGQMWRMWKDPEGKNKYLPYSAYSNRTIGEVKLTHTIHARLSEAEHQKIKEVAASMGQSRSQWLRAVLVKELRSAG